MADLSNIGIHHVTAGDRVELQHVAEGEHDFYALRLPAGVTMFFDGTGTESAANLIGFLDQLHTIAAAVVQDLADSMAAVN